MPFHPSVFDGLLLRARQSAAPGSSLTYSKSFAANPAKVTYVSSLYRDDTLPGVRSLALANTDNCIQFLFPFEGQVYVLTRPTVHTNETGRPIVAGTLTDELETNTPASVRLHSWEGWVSSLLPVASVDAFQLPRGALLPDTIQGEATAPGVHEPGSFARLDFGDDAATLVPTFAAVPMVLGVPLGVHLPSGPSWSLTEPNAELEAVYPFYEVWRSAHAYLAKNNMALSVTMGGPLFDQAAFAVNQFPDTLPLRLTGETNFTMIPPNSPLFAAVDGMVKTSSREALFRIAETLGPAPPVIDVDADTGVPGTAAQGQIGGGLLTSDHLLRAMESMHTKGSASQAEKEHKLAAKVVAAKFSILFARLVPSEDGVSEPTVVPATIRPEFLEILETSKLASATRMLRDAVDTAVRRAACSDNRFDGHVDMTGDMVDAVLTACLREFRILPHSLDTEPVRVKSWVTLLTLVSPGSNSVTFKTRLDQGNVQAFQEAVGEAPAKMDRKSTELFNAGSLTTGQDSIGASANWRVLGNVITDDYDVSECRKSCWCFGKNYYSNAGKIWLGRVLAMPQVPLNLLAAEWYIIASYVAIATVPEYRDAVLGGAPIHAEPFKNANVLATVVATDLYTAVVRNTLTAYSHIPYVAQVLPHLRLTTVTPPAPFALGAAVPPAAFGWPVRMGPEFPPQQGRPYNNAGGGQGGLRGANNPRDNNHRDNNHRDNNHRDNNHRDNNRGGNNNRDNNNRDNNRGAPGAARDPRQDAGREAEKRAGFLTFTGAEAGTRIPIPCDFLVNLPGMQGRERVCIFFCTKGFFCPRGDQCQQVHLPAFNRVPLAVQTGFRAYVERTPGLAFAPGQNPPGAQV